MEKWISAADMTGRTIPHVVSSAAIAWELPTRKALLMRRLLWQLSGGFINKRVPNIVNVGIINLTTPISVSVVTSAAGVPYMPQFLHSFTRQSVG